MDDVIKFKIYFQSSPKAMDSTEKKRGEDGNTKMWISQEWKNLFRWKKAFFIII